MRQLLTILFVALVPVSLHAAAPVRALLITGGCCHNYEFQADALKAGVAKHATVKWTVVNEGGKGTEAPSAV